MACSQAAPRHQHGTNMHSFSILERAIAIKHTESQAATRHHVYPTRCITQHCAQVHMKAHRRAHSRTRRCRLHGPGPANGRSRRGRGGVVLNTGVTRIEVTRIEVTRIEVTRIEVPDRRTRKAGRRTPQQRVQQAATACNTPQQDATSCNTPQRDATSRKWAQQRQPQQAATGCNKPQHAATRRNTPPPGATSRN